MAEYDGEAGEIEHWQLQAIDQAVGALPPGPAGAIRAHYLREHALGEASKIAVEAAEMALVPLAEGRNLIL